MTDQFGKNAKIVIVEDNLALADIYKTRMEMLGYTVFVAYEGRAALDVIQKELPDLVLLDLMVPKIAGDQILETMRASTWGKEIKVLIVSNLNEVDAPAGLREMGIEGYAVKANLSNDQLDQLVDNILKPADQKEDISLEIAATEEITAPSPPENAIPAQSTTTEALLPNSPSSPPQPLTPPASPAPAAPTIPPENTVPAPPTTPPQV